MHSEGTLIVGKDANVEGQVRVGQLILSGRVTGEVTAQRKVILHRTGNLNGNLSTPVLVMEEGAVIEGRITMQPAEKTE